MLSVTQVVFIPVYSKLCIIIVHTLNMYTLYLCTLDNIFLVFNLEMVTSPTVDYIVEFGCNLISFLYI